MASPKTNKAQINKIIYWQTHPLEWVKDIFGDNIKKSPLASKLTDSGLSKQQEDALLQWGEFLDAKLKYAFKKPMTDDEQVLAVKIGMSIMSGTGTGKDFLAAILTWHFMFCFSFIYIFTTNTSNLNNSFSIWIKLCSFFHTSGWIQ